MPSEPTAADQRRRADELRRYATHLDQTPIDELLRWSGPDTWSSPHAEELAVELRRDRARLTAAVEDLRHHAHWLDAQATALDTEARLVLESSVAALAAERATDEHIAELAEEVAEMYAALTDPQEYLIHDVRFHRTIARAAGNPILGALMETITANLYDYRSKTVQNAQDLKESAEMHREIYRAIRSLTEQGVAVVVASSALRSPSTEA